MVPQPKYETGLIKRVLEDTSGYPFELEIIRRIEKWADYGCYVEPNISFEDQDTGEARELDFHVVLALPISMERDEWVFVHIVGSCKDSRNPYVFFTRPDPTAGMMFRAEVPISGYPLEICEDNGESVGIEWYFKLHKLLHIGRTENISSQACVLAWNSGKWVVEKKPVIRDTFVPLVKVMSRKIKEQNDKYIPGHETIKPEYNIYYPLVVIKGHLYEYCVSGSGDTELKDTKHVVVTRHYESKAVRCHYGIDVIDERYLEEYLGLIYKEATKFVNLIRRYRKAVVRSIEQLSRREGTESSEDRGEGNEETT